MVTLLNEKGCGLLNPGNQFVKCTEIPGDGNCFYRAVVDCILNQTWTHALLRQTLQQSVPDCIHHQTWTHNSLRQEVVRKVEEEFNSQNRDQC
jgi:hypothetical protein